MNTFKRGYVLTAAGLLLVMAVIALARVLRAGVDSARDARRERAD